jgi:hypothetical protein
LARRVEDLLLVSAASTTSLLACGQCYDYKFCRFWKYFWPKLWRFYCK